MADVQLSKLIAPTFHDLHVDIRNREHREYWLMGGRGSTKSSFIAIEIILGMMKTPDANAIVYRKVGNTLRESVFEQLLWAVDVLGVNAYWRQRISPMELQYKPTGQRILFRGLDDASKSKSIKLRKGYFAYLWFEEAAEMHGMEDIRTVKASINRGTPQEGKSTTFYSYNPPISARNWVNKEALKEVPGRRKHKSCYLDVPAEWLGAEFIAEAEALKESNERAYRHMYLGEVTGTGGNVFENVTLKEITEEDIRQRSNLYSGIDWGWFPDPFHFTRCSYDAAQMRLWIWDEYRTVRTSDMDVFQYLAKEKNLTAGEEVIADSADNKAINNMRAYGMRCVGAMKGPGSVRAGTKWLQSLKEIIIDSRRCPKTAEEFVGYEYEQNRDGEFVDTYPDKNNHAIDAVRYATNRIWMRAGA